MDREENIPVPGVDSEEFRRFQSAIRSFSVGYNKSVVLTSVTDHSMRIVDRNLGRSQNSLATIVSAFEEIRATSETTSTNTERIRSGITEYLESAENMQESFESRLTELETAEAEAGNIDKMFSSLRNNSNEIRNMTNQIEDVAERTNILAINASIEAARVGNAGAGFRVIANEVRNLALQTSDFAQSITGTITDFSTTVGQINDQLSGFMDLMRGVVKDLNDVKESTARNNVLGREMSNSVEQIHSSVEEQSLALTDGLGNLEQAFSLLRETYTVTQALVSAHDALDSLLDKSS